MRKKNLIFPLCPYLSRNEGKTEYSVVQSGSGAPEQASPDTLVLHQDFNVHIFAKNVFIN
jgi:hypothetical protein